MSTTTLHDITVTYDDTGGDESADDAEVLVLVHGHPFDRSMWRPQTETFAGPGRRVIAADLRGYGGSTVVPGTTTLTTFAWDIAALLDRLGVDRAVLGGLSMGGQIVLEFYRLFPERVRGLVLADTFAAAETEAGKVARNAMADRLLREGMGPYADEVLHKMVAPRNVEALPAVAAHVRDMMRGAPPEGAAAALRGRAQRPDYVAMLGRVTVPALVVVGSEDEYTPVEDARVMSDGIPGATLAVIEGAGHMPNLERREEFDAVLGAFLDTLPPLASRGIDQRDGFENRQGGRATSPRRNPRG
ncbi:alpha/beta hydrolase [Streptomyces camponoticapitis]|uniref:Alpha/beta hydrolase n=1 Tax=Streptomyces camponoticapitis TaxID=1616125 RepID=A0ABQ2E5L5_9ACTN|nr:alpha/beta fold hydrolase [Streptomyces camponoticapitis]GGJ91272.1 alpha/beta hydrolase [Streptomyces camponoticapitis]